MYRLNKKNRIVFLVKKLNFLNIFKKDLFVILFLSTSGRCTLKANLALMYLLSFCLLIRFNEFPNYMIWYEELLRNFRQKLLGWFKCSQTVWFVCENLLGFTDFILKIYFFCLLNCQTVLCTDVALWLKAVHILTMWCQSNTWQQQAFRILFLCPGAKEKK